MLVLPVASSTTAPPAGAAALRVTVPVEELPPTTLVGFKLTEEIWDHLRMLCSSSLPPSVDANASLAKIDASRLRSQEPLVWWPPILLPVGESNGNATAGSLGNRLRSCWRKAGGRWW